MRKKVGLALSGAVARGAAHIGVLHVLEGAGVPIDFVCGVSAGALVGALYCAGYAPASIFAMLNQFSWARVAGIEWPPRQGFFTFARLEQWLVERIGDCTFADLKRRFAVIATDLKTGMAVTIAEGPVAPAVRASCSVPGFVSPVENDDQVLCDGGIACNLPAPQVRVLGAEYVIGVDLFQTHLRPGWGPLGYGLAAIETMVRQSGEGHAAADCLITPELAGAPYVSLRRFKEYVALGAMATEERLPEIRAALGIDALDQVEGEGSSPVLSS